MLRVYRPPSPLRWTWIAMKGPDTADFLHRLTTVNVKTLRPGQGSPGFFLNPQGKMRAYFHLWRVAPDEFGFELDSGADGRWKKSLLEVIEQFHFGEKFTLEAEAPLAYAWVFGAGGETLVPELAPRTLREENGVRFLHHGDADFGLPWISVWAPNTGTDAAETLERALKALPGNPSLAPISWAELETLRISALSPAVDAELTENTLPLEVGLGNAIAGNKGCYPGQEVIEKIISLGSPARRLALLRGEGPAPAVGAPVRATESGQEVGAITSVTSTPADAANGFLALALIRKTHAREGVAVSLGPNAAQARIARVAG